MAPIYDRHVAEGNLASWGRMEHVAGGHWRRILTMTAPDHPGLLATRAEIIQEKLKVESQTSPNPGIGGRPRATAIKGAFGLLPQWPGTPEAPGWNR